MRKGSALLVSCLLALTASAQADLVVNGGFETGSFNNGMGAGWTQFGTLSPAGVSSSPPIPHTGTYGAFFSTSTNSGIRQTLNAHVGDVIQLTFWLANRSGVTTFFDVSLGGAAVFSLTNSPASGYTQRSFNVPVVVENPILEFRFRNLEGRWDFDDVSAVNLVPLPTGAAIGLAGLAGVGMIARVRRRRGC